MTHESLQVLLVEDSPDDVRLTREAMKQAEFTPSLRVVPDGESALAFLEDPEEDLPDLILLDLNLPGLSGREVLSTIKSDPELASVPVCILTTSSADEDIRAAYASHTNCYIVKPLDFERYVEVVRQLREFWGGVAALPRRAEGRRAG